MINIIKEDGTFNERFKMFPNAIATIAIFGTQSTGKSTLMNHAFNSHFPILNPKKDRKRCTKGVWFENINNFNLIDTEGFDSGQRPPEQKILEKRIALFCLAMADAVIINLWMNQIGRYEGSHINIIKSIIKVSERLVGAQTKTVLFVVKDCEEDADREVLKQELEFRVNQIYNQVDRSRKVVRLNVCYHFMSHYFYKKDSYIKEAQKIKQFIKIKKSHLFNYSPEDRIIYMKDLWEKINSPESEVDLKSIEDALRIYALEKIKDQTIEQFFKIIQKVTNLNRHKSFQRFSQFIKKQAEKRFLAQKPAHIQQKQFAQYLAEIKEILNYSITKQFLSFILPAQEDKLLIELEKSLAILERSQQLQKITIRKKKQTMEIYKKIIAGHKESLSLLRKFTQRTNQILVKYERQISHIFNMFENNLQKQLNDELDRQLNLKSIRFDREEIDKKIKKVCKEFEYNSWEINFKEMWQKIYHRTINNRLPERIEELSNAFVSEISIWSGDQTTNILAFHHKLEKQCESFCSNVLNYFEQETIIYHPFDKVKDQIRTLIDKALRKQKTRFHITLVMIGLFMYLFYGEFVYLLSILPMKSKKRKYWVKLYLFSLTLVVVVCLYHRRSQIKRLLGMNQQPNELMSRKSVKIFQLDCQ